MNFNKMDKQISELIGIDMNEWSTQFLTPVGLVFRMLIEAKQENKKLLEENDRLKSELAFLQNQLTPPSPAKRVTHNLIDLPEGWLYGFPKVYTGDVEDFQEIINWAVKEGYPSKVISEYKDKFYIRVIEMEEND